jgi:hypothetical protein
VPEDATIARLGVTFTEMPDLESAEVVEAALRFDWPSEKLGKKRIATRPKKAGENVLMGDQASVKPGASIFNGMWPEILGDLHAIEPS